MKKAVAASQKKIWQQIWHDRQSLSEPNVFAVNTLKYINEYKLETLLDLGCGNGVDSIVFAKQGLKVTRADWSETALNQIQIYIHQHHIQNLSLVNQDLATYLNAKQKFDVIYAHLSLYYFADQTSRQIFRSTQNNLNSGGLFCVKCKSTDDPLYGQGQRLEENYYSLKGHVRYFFHWNIWRNYY